MKYKLLHLIVLAPFLSAVKVGPKGTCVISYSQLGPYEKYQPASSFSFSIMNKTGVSSTFYLQTQFGDNVIENRIVNNVGYYPLDNNTGQTITTNIPTDMLLGDDGMKIKIIVRNQSFTGSIINSVTSYIYPIKEETLNPFELPSGIYESQNISSTCDKNQVTHQKEKISFANYVDYFLTDTCYQIPVEQYGFIYEYDGESFSFGSANMKLVGVEEFFPGLLKGKKMSAVSLDLTQSGKNVSISFKNGLYVHPKYLLMSHTAKMGYVSTHHFFLPVNHIDDLNGMGVNFTLSNVGANKITFSWQSTFYANSGLIGKCQNSEYCIEGRISR